MKRFRSKRSFRLRRRAAVSETIATIVLIAATVVLGAVAWVWASSQSVASQNSLGQAAQTNIHAVSERFEIVATNFTYSGTGTATSVQIWIYNSGIYNTNISSIMINGVTYTNPTNPPTNYWSLPQGLVAIPKITFTTPISVGTAINIKAIGQYGFYTTYQAVA